MAGKFGWWSLEFNISHHIADLSLQGMTSLPDYVPFNHCPPTPFRNLFTAAGDDAIDLLSKLMKFNPLERLTAAEVRSVVYREILISLFRHCVTLILPTNHFQLLLTFFLVSMSANK